MRVALSLHGRPLPAHNRGGGTAAPLIRKTCTFMSSHFASSIFFTISLPARNASPRRNCHYCPNEPGQPRSYLHDEPAVLRANQNGFDPVLQFTDRAATLAVNGHPVDKIEILVLGGTWASYPHAYQEAFCRDLFYAANTFHEREKRPRLGIEEEQRLNEAAACKVIGLTLETRPDTITPEEIRRLRRYGCTRVQLGVQHSDDDILRKINRGCTTEDTIRALRLLKDTCYKARTGVDQTRRPY